jgi:mRNA interferase YafQ
MLEIIYTNKFKKDYKILKKRNKKLEKLQKVIQLLVIQDDLPLKYKDHKLIGNYDSCKECHIEPDWLLIYQVDQENNKLYLARTGSHSDLFD